MSKTCNFTTPYYTASRLLLCCWRVLFSHKNMRNHIARRLSFSHTVLGILKETLNYGKTLQ
jgi:hypothetical protein